MMKLEKTLKIKIYDVVFSLLVFALPLSVAVPNILLGALAFIFFLRIKEVSWNSYLKGENGILLALYLFVALMIGFNGELNSDIPLLMRFSIFLFLPLFGLLVSNLNYLKIAFVLGINCSLVLSFYSIFHFYFNEGTFPFGNTRYVNQILTLERPYLGFFCALNIILSLELRKIFKSFNFCSNLLLFSAFLSFVFIFLISAKMSIISILVVLLVGLYRLDLNKKRRKLFLLGTLLFVGAIITFNGNIKKRFYIEKNFQKTLEKAKVYEPRFTIWDCSLSILNSSADITLLGVGGFNKSEEKLSDCYIYTIPNPSKREYYLNEGFNSHNQFLDLWLSVGIGPLFLLSAYFIFLFKKRFNNYHSISIIILFVSFFMVENVLHRQLGCYLFGILGLLTSSRKT
ncbi:O-antigen ligase family protein [Flagellimonas olearia]|nr:O-antigen ligase family protein [Allomuricauda olearia]